MKEKEFNLSEHRIWRQGLPVIETKYVKEFIKRDKQISIDPSEVIEFAQHHIFRNDIRKVMENKRLARAILGICQNIREIKIDTLVGEELI